MSHFLCGDWPADWLDSVSVYTETESIFGLHMYISYQKNIYTTNNIFSKVTNILWTAQMLFLWIVHCPQQWVSNSIWEGKPQASGTPSRWYILVESKYTRPRTSEGVRGTGPPQQDAVTWKRPYCVCMTCVPCHIPDKEVFNGWTTKKEIEPVWRKLAHQKHWGEGDVCRQLMNGVDIQPSMNSNGFCQ